ncbi:MAG: Hint domain-containing protein, partial [Alphaproteobacteria bacterium]|nr:Hint domain-containing protein [Alphaproteobacteria bacterium]
MARDSWIGGSGLWTDAALWLDASVPATDDSVTIAAGTVAMPGPGLFAPWHVALGGRSAFAGATIETGGARFDQRFVIESSGTDAFARFVATGAVGFYGTIEAAAPGGTFTLDAQPSAAVAGDFVLLGDASVDVSAGDTLVAEGTISNHATITVEAGSTFFNAGTIAQSSGALEIEAGATLGGPGVVDIGLYSSLYLQPGAAPTAIAVRFTDVGGRLLLGDPAAFYGTISNFQQGDLIDLTDLTADSATLSAGGLLTVTEGGAVVATLDVSGPASGALSVSPDGAGGSLIEVPGTAERTRYTIGGPDRAMHADVVRSAMTMPDGTPITGTGAKIGIISDSFDATPGIGAADPANADALAGYLPLDAASGRSAVQVLQDGSGSDEGRAMAEIVHAIAPGAAIAFAAGGADLDSFAASVTALENAGCNIIVDDLVYDDEPFLATAGPADLAIANAVAAGVSYFTAAGNFANNAFAAAFTPQVATLSDGTIAPAEIFSSGAPYQTLTLTGSVQTDLMLQWNAAWPGSGQSVPDLLQARLYDANGNLAAVSSQVRDANGAALPETELTETPLVTGQYRLAITALVDDPGPLNFKYVMFGTDPAGGSGPNGTIDDPGADAGTVIGHAMLPQVNTVGAVNFAATPAFGDAASYAEYFSDVGAADAGQVDFLAPDGAATAVPGFAPFEGTSAAAPAAAAVAALILQADPAATPAQVSAMLQASAADLGLPADLQGAGLVQADGAVEQALAAACFAAGTRIATARGPVAIERLRRGDLLRTASGRSAPAIWLGHRRVDCRRHPRPHDVWPVRVAAHAFAPQIPCRDLLLSPDHAVWIDGLLIPIRQLINGATIAQRRVDRVTYWHVELPAHDVVLAENLPAESFLDTGNRAWFAGEPARGGGVRRRHAA